MISLNGDVTFTVQFKADVCNPVIGSVLKCQVKNINKFGILAAAYDENDSTHGVVEVIISKQGTFSSDLDLNNIKIGDSVNVELLGKKFEINDRKITAIGRVVNHEVVHQGGGTVDAEENGGDEVEDVEDDDAYEDENEDGDEDDEEIEVNDDVDGEGEGEGDDDEIDDEEGSIGDLEAPSITDSVPGDDIEDVPDDVSEYDI